MRDNRAIVLEILEKSHGITFTRDEVVSLQGPCVYVVLRGEAPRYVGMSAAGISRVLDRRHHRLQGHFEATDTVQVWFVKDVTTARQLETLLIDRLRPELNLNGVERIRCVKQHLGLSGTHARTLRRLVQRDGRSRARRGDATGTVPQEKI